MSKSSPLGHRAGVRTHRADSSRAKSGPVLVPDPDKPSGERPGLWPHCLAVTCIAPGSCGSLSPQTHSCMFPAAQGPCSLLAGDTGALTLWRCTVLMWCCHGASSCTQRGWTRLGNWGSTLKIEEFWFHLQRQLVTLESKLRAKHCFKTSLANHCGWFPSFTLVHGHNKWFCIYTRVAVTHYTPLLAVTPLDMLLHTWWFPFSTSWIVLL